MEILRCIVSLANVRKEPHHAAELHTQLFLGYQVILLQKTNTYWWQIQHHDNDYQGYVLASQFESISSGEGDGKAFNYLLENSFMQGLHPLTIWPNHMIPSLQRVFNSEGIMEYCEAMLGSPYFWGGISGWGIDCSGLSRLLYFYHQINLPHQAQLQMNYGNPVDFIAEAQCGDLAFFANQLGEIYHIGIMLSPSEIIHASEVNGVVAVDWIDQEGILNKKTGNRTHTLRLIKRLV